MGLSLSRPFGLGFGLFLTGRFGDLSVFEAAGGVVGVVVVPAVDGDALLEEALDVLEVGQFLAGAEADGLAGGAGAGGSADAVDIALRFVGQVEVDDVGHAVDVDAAGGDIRRDEHADRALAETVQGPCAGVLALVAMDGGDGIRPWLRCL